LGLPHECFFPLHLRCQPSVRQTLFIQHR
jgi:hypothetical protein